MKPLANISNNDIQNCLIGLGKYYLNCRKENLNHTANDIKKTWDKLQEYYDKVKE